MYTSIYDFNVIDELKKGTDVKCFDKADVVHYDLRELTVAELLEILTLAHDDKQDRFLFYYFEEGCNHDDL